ncbi:hypothetical protein TNCV_1019981 [Trichonephila clavipes]|nr:hypothetical protein TNCV_1019981 [Trichonephila clavipes]
MVATRAGFVSNQVKQGIPPKVIQSECEKLDESGQKHRLSPSASGSDPQWPRFPMAFQGSCFLGHGSTFVNVCGCNAVCSSEGQRDFRLIRLSSLLSFLVGSLIAGDPNMIWNSL